MCPCNIQPCWTCHHEDVMYLIYCQTAKPIKACISETTCGKNLATELFHSGYAQGQTRGFVCSLTSYMLTQLPKEPWEVPEVILALESFTRLKVVYVIYQTPLERSVDSIGQGYNLHATCLQYLLVLVHTVGVADIAAWRLERSYVVCSPLCKESKPGQRGWKRLTH